MPNLIRDLITKPLTMDYIKQRTDEGWIAAAVEWVKPLDAQQIGSADNLSSEDVPFGQRVSADCEHLVDNPQEIDLLLSIYEKVVAGWRPTNIAADLNSRGHRTRGGEQWTPAAVFDLMPRLIELSPRLQIRPDWPSRRAALKILV